MEKKKKIIILGVITLVLVITGVTYAILTWTSSKINLGLTSGCFTIDYTKGNDIANASIKTISEDDLISNNKFTIKEGIALTYANIGIKSSCTIEGYGSLYLNVTSLSDAFTTGQSKGALKYAVLSNTSTTSTITVAGLLNQSFDIVANGSITSTGTITLLTKQLSNTSLNKYLIVVYIDDNMVGNDAIGASFDGTISADANQGSIADYTLQRLHNLNNTIALDTSKTPDFSTVSGNSGVKKYDGASDTTILNQGDGTKGIYKTEDDFGTSYYFRGAVENNYVNFAGFYWRIIRINGDGSIRMIYAGTSAHANGYDDSSDRDMDIGDTEYNTSSNDNTYVGYMYGTAGASTYASTHSNTNNSTIKEYIDNWYIDNLKEYSYYLEDTIYCNDRKVVNINDLGGMTLTGNGSGTNESNYAGAYRALISHSPTLKCENKNDRFTVSNSMGNTKLTYPVALITADEVIYAGGLSVDLITNAYITNIDFYLFLNYFYWTMTPSEFLIESGSSAFYFESGVLGTAEPEYSGAARPVISLIPTAINGGSGTMNDPFTVD